MKLHFIEVYSISSLNTNGKGSWPWESLARILPSRRWTIDLADLLHVHGAREQDRKQ